MSPGSRLPRGRDFHGVVDGVVAAAHHSEARVALVGLPSESRFRNRLGLPRPAWHRARALLQHQQLPGLVREHSGCDLILLREFLTLPLLLAAPRLLRYRRRLLLTSTHNLQQGRVHWLHRGALRTLGRFGFGFCCLESDVGFADVVSRRGRQTPLVLPHVIAPGDGRSPEPRGHDRPRLGVVGLFRPEKQMEPLLERLTSLRARGLLPVELLLGCPDSGLAERWGRRVDLVVDTRRRPDYERALGLCDVVAFNYAERRYWLRGSGVVTNAVVAGCAIVCPEFPVLRAQVTQPRPVGALFGSLEDLLPAIERALQARRSDPGAFEAYRSARCPRAIAAHLDLYALKRGLRRNGPSATEGAAPGGQGRG